jgi:hypothetical protein
VGLGPAGGGAGIGRKPGTAPLQLVGEGFCFYLKSGKRCGRLDAGCLNCLRRLEPVGKIRYGKWLKNAVCSIKYNCIFNVSELIFLTGSYRRVFRLPAASLPHRDILILYSFSFSRNHALHHNPQKNPFQDTRLSCWSPYNQLTIRLN